jgi:tetratricopeptide (TPR) repeat protein
MKMRPQSLALATVAALVVASAPAWAQSPATANPSDTPGYFFLLGRHLESEGKIDEAIAAHKRAIEMEPQSAELRAELAALYARQDRAVEALEQAEAAVQRDPDNQEANRIMGSVFAALSDQRRALRPGDNPAEYPKRAIAALEKARRSGSDPGVDLMLGRLYVQTRAYDKAVPVLRRVLDEQPGISEAAMLLSLSQENIGDVPGAIATLERALDDTPRFYRGLLRIAELHEKQNQWKEAADAYGRAQQMNVRATDVLPRRAAALINAGRAKEAGDLLRESAARPTADAGTLYLYAVAQRQQKDLAGAEATARRLRAAVPDDPRGMYVMAQILDDKGDRAGAESSLRDLLAKDPLDATALNHLGYMFAERGERLDEAVDLVQRALKVEPDNASFLDSLGWAYFQQGKVDLADGPLTQAAERLPSSSVVQEHLGDLRFRQQRYADAAAAWERSLAGDGDSIDRARIEKKIRDARARMNVK